MDGFVIVTMLPGRGYLEQSHSANLSYLHKIHFWAGKGGGAKAPSHLK